jgi:endonuclease/exonuclease/phosphatase family metal-dependent hydrolase
MKHACILLTALTLVLGGQLFRVLLPGLFYYAVPILGLELGQLVAAAYMPVLAAPLAAFLAERFGLDGITRVFGLGLLVCRLVEQVSRSARMDTLVAILGVTFFWGLLPLLYALDRTDGSSRGQCFALGLLFGWSADTLLRGLTGTLDLSWITAGWASVIILFLGAVFAVGLWAIPSQASNQRGVRLQTGLPMLGLGPLFFIQWQFFQNQGWTNTLTGWAPAAVLTWLMLANAAAIGAALFAMRPPARPAPAGNLLLGLALFGSLLLIEQRDGVFALALLVGIVSAGLLLVTLTGTSGILPLGLVLGLALVMGMGLISLYYTSFLMPGLPFLRFSLAPGAAVVLALCAWALRRQNWAARQRPPVFAALSWCALIVLAPLIFWGIESQATPTYQPSEESLRVITYNIHAGYGQDARLDVAAVSQVIADSGADVVGLQELSRGWLISGGVDLLPLFQRSLEMPAAIMGPAADPIGGNGLFSRREILSSSYASLPQLDGLVGRSYVWGELDWVEDNTLLVIVTHLDSERRDIRLAQIQALLAVWGGRSHTVLIGDMNAQPGSSEIQLITEAGFQDAWAEAGQPERPRLDWIFFTPDLQAQDVVVFESPASDHPAFAATIIPLR